MKFELNGEYIELYKLIKVMDLVDSGGHAKILIEQGQVKRDGKVELRKRAKIVVGESIKVNDDVIEIVSSS